MATTLAEANANAGAAGQKPIRMSIRDLNTGELLEAQFNPTNLDESITVDWARLKPPGLSHEVLQYDHTENYKPGPLELVFDALGEGWSVDRIGEARKFLLSVCYSKSGAQSVREGEATRVLLFWPNLMSLTCVLTSLKIKHSRFNLAGQPTYFVATVALEEIRDARLFSEDVRNSGTVRSANALFSDTGTDGT